jgi:hypothetical protein
MIKQNYSFEQLLHNKWLIFCSDLPKLLPTDENGSELLNLAYNLNLSSYEKDQTKQCNPKWL